MNEKENEKGMVYGHKSAPECAWAHMGARMVPRNIRVMSLFLGIIWEPEGRKGF